MSYQSVLALAPHTDDAELGCGGTIARLLDEGAEVHVVTFSSAQESLPEGAPKDLLVNECYEALQRLGVKRENIIILNYPVRRFSYQRQEILEDLIQLRRDLRPELVLLPASQDLHQDHQIIHAEGLRAFKEVSVLGYELPWNHIQFSAQVFFPLERKDLNRKWEALQAYRSQVELGRKYFTKDFIEGLASVRGLQIKSEWAEAYEALKVKL